MDKKPTLLILFGLINVISVVLAFGAGTPGRAFLPRRTLELPDGFVLRGVDGKLIRKDINDPSLRGPQSLGLLTEDALRRDKLAPANAEVWFFEFDSAVIDGYDRAGITARLELLPSSALEKMAADANDPLRRTEGYRLWARVTKYKGRNFIFPIDFLPLSESKSLDSLTSQQTEEKDQPGQRRVGIANDELGIPKEILEKLRNRPTLPSAGREQPERTAAATAVRRLQITHNYVLSNRTGFISPCVTRDIHRAEAITQYVFVLDALGRSATSTGDTFRLLPCQTLELAEQIQSVEPDQVRFNIAGIVTEYRGGKFLLLHRATRAYSHGNLGR
jgi:hypothetical protein